jgi:hypothetical protein
MVNKTNGRINNINYINKNYFLYSNYISLNN